MRIKILVDDLSGKRGCISEHGLSLIIEWKDKKILFDTGLNISLLNNLKKREIDINKISYIILSHGHDDHTGGLIALLKELNRSINIYAHPDIFTEKYKDRGNTKKYIGIPEKRETYEKLGGKFILKREFFEIEDGLYFSGEIERKNILSDNTLLIREGNEFKVDPLLDDISVGIKLDSGIFVITGCNHSGLSNTLAHFYNKLHLPITGVLGGLHLLNFEERIEDAIKTIFPLHCTETYGKCRLLYEFGERVSLLKTCDEIKI